MSLWEDPRGVAILRISFPDVPMSQDDIDVLGDSCQRVRPRGANGAALIAAARERIASGGTGDASHLVVGAVLSRRR